MLVLVDSLYRKRPKTHGTRAIEFNMANQKIPRDLYVYVLSTLTPYSTRDIGFLPIMEGNLWAQGYRPSNGLCFMCAP